MVQQCFPSRLLSIEHGMLPDLSETARSHGRYVDGLWSHLFWAWWEAIEGKYGSVVVILGYKLARPHRNWLSFGGRISTRQPCDYMTYVVLKHGLFNLFYGISSPCSILVNRMLSFWWNSAPRQTMTMKSGECLKKCRPKHILQRRFYATMK